MKIAVSGTSNLGKSTFVKDFLKNWPNYTTPKKTYRDFAKEKKIKINQEGNRDSQYAILNYQVDIAQKYSKKDNVIFDRCVLDPLVYSLWLYEKDKGNIKDDDIEKMLRITKEALKMYNIIFYIPMTGFSPNLNENKNPLRDPDEIYRKEIDNIFSAVNKSYLESTGVVFPLEDCPALITLEGNREERIILTKLYVTAEGTAYGENESLIQQP